MARQRVRRYRNALLLVAMLVTALMIFYDLRRLFGSADDPEPGASAPLGMLDTDSTDTAGSPAEATADTLSTEPVGSMARSLLDGTEASRNHIFHRTIVDVGFACAQISKSGAVGSSGVLWRVRCSDPAVYQVEVDEFGRLVVSPVPYGDVLPSRDMTEPTPERSLQEPQRR